MHYVICIWYTSPLCYKGCAFHRIMPGQVQRRYITCFNLSSIQERASHRLYYLSAKIVPAVRGSLLYIWQNKSPHEGLLGAVVGFGPDPYCPQRPSCPPLARELISVPGRDSIIVGRYIYIQIHMMWLYLDAEVLVLPPVLSSGLFCRLPIFVDIQYVFNKYRRSVRRDAPSTGLCRGQVQRINTLYHIYSILMYYFHKIWCGGGLFLVSNVYIHIYIIYLFI